MVTIRVHMIMEFRLMSISPLVQYVPIQTSGYFLSSRIHSCNRSTQQLAGLHISSLSYEIRFFILGKATWKTLKLLLTVKQVNKSNIPLFKEFQILVPPAETCKIAEVIVPIICPFD